MTVQATDVVLRLHGAQEIWLLLAKRMTGQAALAHFLGGGTLRRKDFGLAPTPIHVGLARAVARLATLPLRPLFAPECRGEVARFLVGFGFVFVAGLADF